MNVNFVTTFEDKNLIGAAFPNLETWRPWLTAMKAADGKPLTKKETELFRQCTNRERPSTAPAKEIFFIVGRRGGKGRIAAALGAHLAAFRDYSKILAPGELGLLPIIASDREQARIVLNYIRDIFTLSPVLRRMVVKSDLTWEIPLKNRVTIRVMTSSQAAVRGYTLVGAILEETAFWRSEGANPDREIVRALRPGRLTTKGPLIVISTPYRRVGVLWEAHQKHWGRDSSTLVWVAPSLTMNPTLDPEEIDAEMAADPESARAEYFCEFRSDLEDFLPLEVIEACIVPGRFELPFIQGVSYKGFVDPSGGRGDAATLAIGHKEKDLVVLDLARRWPSPHDPSVVAGEMTDILKSYGVHRVSGDRYSGNWVSAEFSKAGITYEASEKDKSALFLELMPMVLSGRVELLDSKTLTSELAGLERRTRSGGRDSIDHGPGAHDDLANAVAGVVALLGSKSEPGMLTWIRNLAQADRTAEDNRAHEHRVHTAAGTQVGYTKVIHRCGGPPQGLSPTELAEWIRMNR